MLFFSHIFLFILIGLISFLIILTLCLLYMANTFLTKSNDGKNLYIGKVFFTVLMCFVIVPSIIVFKNKNIVKHSSQTIKSSALWKIVTLLSFKFMAKGCCSTSVHPDKLVDNLEAGGHIGLEIVMREESSLPNLSSLT